MSYVFDAAFTVAAGAAMAVGPNVTVWAESGTTFSDAGAMTFSSGDQLVLYNTSLSVAGSLTANGTDFVNDGGNVNFGSAATLSGGTNTFAAPVYVPYTLVPSLAGNASFGQVYIEAGTDTSSTPLALNLIGSNASMSYVFDAAFTVAAGAAMAVGPNVTVWAESGTTFSDAGAMTFSSGDQLVLYNTSLSVAGSLTANGTDFVNDGGNVNFGSAATLSGGTNTFAAPVYVPYTLVPSLAGNASFGQVYIEAGTDTSSTPLALNLIGSNASMSYVFDAAFTVAAGAAMAVGPNVTVWAESGATFSDAGAMTFSSGDQLVLYNTSLSVGGSLTANGTDFVNDGGNVTFGSAATLSGGTNTFAAPVYVPYTLVPSLAGNASFGQVYIEAGTDTSRPPGAEPDRQQREHELCVRRRLHRGRRRRDDGRPERDGLGGVGDDVQRRRGHDLLQRRPGHLVRHVALRRRQPDRQRHRLRQRRRQRHLRLGRDAQRRHQHLRRAGLRALHARPLAGGQRQLRSGLHRGGHRRQQLPLALNLIGSNANMSYVFDAAFTVAAGAAMTVGPNVTVWAESGTTFSDAGAMTFSSGDQVILYGTSLSVGGSLTANGTDFVNDGGNIVVNSGGDLVASGSTFGVPLSLASGSTANLQEVAFDSQLAINSGATIDIQSDDFTKGTVVASGDLERDDQFDQQLLGHDQPHADRGQDHGSRQ